MIELNELVFPEKLAKFTTRRILINENNILYMYDDKVSMSAPTVVDSLVYGDNVPDERRKILDTVECTTIQLVGGTDIDVKETMEEIKELLK